MQAITTKVLPATYHRPMRCKATAQAGSVTISVDQYESTNEAHGEAAKALCLKFGWVGCLAMGTTHKGDNVFVFVPRIAGVARWNDMLTVGNPIREELRRANHD